MKGNGPLKYRYAMPMAAFSGLAALLSGVNQGAAYQLSLAFKF
jgi:hypothetical protein